MELSYRINYNKEQIFTFLLCINRNNIILYTDLILYIIDFLDYKMDLKQLTININHVMIDYDIEYIYNILWKDINKLRLDKHRDLSLSNWEYKDDFLLSEKYHTNDRAFDKLDWEKNFMMYFLYCIFH